MNIIGRPLKDIVDDLERLNTECRKWYADNVAQQVAACQCKEAVHEIHEELSQSCVGDDGQIRDLPCEITIPLIFAWTGDFTEVRNSSPDAEPQGQAP